MPDDASDRFPDEHNRNPRTFVRTAIPHEITGTVNTAKQSFESINISA